MYGSALIRTTFTQPHIEVKWLQHNRHIALAKALAYISGTLAIGFFSSLIISGLIPLALLWNVTLFIGSPFVGHYTCEYLCEPTNIGNYGTRNLVYPRPTRFQKTMRIALKALRALVIGYLVFALFHA